MSLSSSTARNLLAGLLSTLGVVLMLALAPLYVSALRLPALGLFHDDAVYTVTAKALAEGRGYRIISLPDEPLQTKYPPVFPLLLAAVWKVTPTFPDNVTALKAVPLVGAIAWLLLTLRLYRALGVPRPLSVAAVAAVASVTWVLYLSVTLLSETVFAALCTAALVCVEADGDFETQAPSTLRVVQAAILAALATLTRTVGISLVLAGIGWLLVTRRDPRRAAIFMVVAGAILLPWTIWIAANPDAGYYGVSNYAGWNVLTLSRDITLALRARVLAMNMLWTGQAPAMLFDVPAGPAAVMITFFVLALGVFRLGRPCRVTFWFLVFYLLLILGWAWPPQRFVVVVLPLLLWPVLALVSKTRAATLAATAVVLLLAGHSASAMRQHVQDSVPRGRLEPGALDVETWDEVTAANAWIQSHTRLDERLMGNLDPMYYLWTGRKAVRGFDGNAFLLRYSPDPSGALGDANRMRGAIRVSGAAIIVDSPDALYAERPILKALYRELEQRGDIDLVASIGRFRFFRPRLEVARPEGQSPASPTHGPDAAPPDR